MVRVEMPMERTKKDAGFVLLRMIFVVCVLGYPFCKTHPVRIKQVFVARRNNSVSSYANY